MGYSTRPDNNLKEVSRFRRKVLPATPRRERSIRIARQFMIESGIRYLPVEPSSLFEQHGWLLYSCSQAARIYGRPDPFGLICARADARTLRSRDTGIYVTIFRASARANRVRWTLAHEIGHIVLGHLTDFEATCLCRGGLKSREYRTLEREADLFAAELLMPMAITRASGAWSVKAIVQSCRVSRQAAQHRVLDFCKWGDTPIAWEDDALLRSHFSPYLNGKRPARGQDVTIMRHRSVLTDDNGRFLTCPRCGNKDFSDNADHCKMCGLFLYNKCENDLCGMTNPGDARYCEYCGCETFLMLFNWDEMEPKGEVKDELEGPG